MLRHDLAREEDRLWLLWKAPDSQARLIGSGRIRAAPNGGVSWTNRTAPGIVPMANALGYGGPTNMAFLRVREGWISPDDTVTDAVAEPAPGLVAATDEEVRALRELQTRLIQACVLDSVRDALQVPSDARFFETERGYQGRLYCTLQAALDRRGLLPQGTILELEYQKSARHGNLHQRPDMVLHIPAVRGPVTENNFAAVALKHHAGRAMALEDFQKLDEMCEALDYKTAIFINVSSDETLLEHYEGPFPDRVHAFAVRLAEGAVVVVEGRPHEG